MRYPNLETKLQLNANLSSNHELMLVTPKWLTFGITNVLDCFSNQALAKKDPVRRQVLRVKGCLAGSKAENLLEQGDMVLAINKEPVTNFRDVEGACQELDRTSGHDGSLSMTISRQVWSFLL
jgi:hypothetical protein